LQHSKKPQHISPFTLKILKNIDYVSLITRRKENIRIIYDTLSPASYLLLRNNYDADCMLTGVPVISKNCNKLVSFMRHHSIECLSYKKSWFFMPEGKENEYIAENFFLQNHFLFPIHENNEDYSKTLILLTKSGFLQ